MSDRVLLTSKKHLTESTFKLKICQKDSFWHIFNLNVESVSYSLLLSKTQSDKDPSRVLRNLGNIN